MESEIGTLVVVVLKARNLHDKHSFYKQDVFAQVSLNGVVKRTPVDVKGGQHPVWDAELRYPVMKDTAENFRKLQVACYAKEPRSDDLLGKGEVDITETLRTGEFDDWVGLGLNNVVRGEVYLEMTFFSNGPAPAPNDTLIVSSLLTRRLSKLSPSERLYRPPPSPSPKSSTSHLDGKGAGSHLGQGNIFPASDGKHLAPGSSHSSRSSSLSSVRAESPLPPLPVEPHSHAPLPNALLPAGGIARPKSHERPASAAHVPNVLRPGPATGSSPQPALTHRRHPSASPPRHTEVLPPSSRVYPGPAPSSSPQPAPTRGRHLSASPPHRTEILPSLSHSYPAYAPTAPPFHHQPGQVRQPAPAPSPAYVPPTSAASSPWTEQLATTPSGPPLFPVPVVSTVEDPYPTPVPVTTTVPTSAYTPSDGRPHTHVPSVYQTPSYPPENEFPDPYLQARYQTPLPLPPGEALNPSRGRLPPAAPKDTEDKDHVIALQLAQEEEARQKEQEAKDLELALQLDRELNLDT